MTLMRAQRCSARSKATGNQCRRHAILGGGVCVVHGGQAPQVKAAAARRVTLAEALASTDRRHPQEVLASALHQVDTMAEHVLDAMRAGDLGTTPEMVSVAVDANRTRAGMAKLVLETGGEAWSASEAYRQQGDALAKICREMARELGHDPGDDRVAAAFEVAVARVLYGQKGPRARPVAALEPRTARSEPSARTIVDGEVVA